MRHLKQHNAVFIERGKTKMKVDCTLTKAVITDLIYSEVGLSKQEAKEFVDTFFAEIQEALIRGEEVKLSGFGNFQLRNKNERPGRNPKTGEEVLISARRVVTYSPSAKLKAGLSGG